jgi:hypothetical protein
VAVNLSGVFNSDIKLVLVVNENISDVHLGDAQLSLWAFSLASHVEAQSFLGASHIAEGSARVVVWTLGLKGHTAGDFSVGPNLSLEGLDRENLILEKHGVFIDSFLNSLVLSGKGSNCSIKTQKR